MTNEPTSPATLHRPVLLREVFCLTTLVGAFLALVLNFSFSGHERWLVGLTLGGSLLGIATARMGKQRVWLSGFLAGTLGGLIAMGIMGQEWLDHLDTKYWDAQELVAVAAITLALSAILAIIHVACFQLFCWATDGSQQGMLGVMRRNPYRSATVATIVGGLILCIANIDFLLEPQAWSSRHIITLPPLERPIVSSKGMYTVRTGSLSRNGEWLLVESFMPGIGREVAEKEMYLLDPSSHRVNFADRPERASFVAFDCDSNRIAYLEWLGESYDDRPEQSHTLRIVDLDDNSRAALSEKPRDSDQHSIQWLPGGALVIHYGDSWNGKKGFTKLEPHQGQWTRQESELATSFSPHSGKYLEFDETGMRMIDLKSSRQIARFNREWVDKMMEFLGGNPEDWLQLSSDGRWILAGAKIYDRESKSIRDWGEADMELQPWIFGFTPRGNLLYKDRSNFLAWEQYLILAKVPLVSRLFQWLTREPIRLIDHRTGREVARTRPLGSMIDDVVLSYDGSRMAVFTDDGVYIYDVPAEFR